MNYEIVKLHYNSPYEGWTTKEPKNKSLCYDFGYFLKIEGKYFKLGDSDDEFYVTEEEE